MKKDNHSEIKAQKTENQQGTNSRRQFIKKASVSGATITTLSAQSVWGACTVSGALSGGSGTRRESCDFPSASGGASPSAWKTHMESNTTCSPNESIDLDASLNNTLTLNISSAITDAIAPNNHLAAAYLNFKHNIYSSAPMGFSNATEFTQYLYAVSQRYAFDEGNLNNFINNLNATYSATPPTLPTTSC